MWVESEADPAAALSQSHSPQAVISPDTEWCGQYHSERQHLPERPGLG